MPASFGPLISRGPSPVPPPRREPHPGRGVAGGVEAAHLILGHADRVLDAAQDDGAVAGEPLDQLVSLSATTTVLTTRGEVRFLGPNVVPRAPRANTRKRLQETRGEALPRCGPCVARNVTVHESRVTSVQKRMEPRRSLLGASVDVTDARKARWATLRPEVRDGCGIATGLPRQRFPSDPPPSLVTET